MNGYKNESQDCELFYDHVSVKKNTHGSRRNRNRANINLVPQDRAGALSFITLLALFVLTRRMVAAKTDSAAMEVLDKVTYRNEEGVNLVHFQFLIG